MTGAVTQDGLMVHASCVALGGKAAIITGASGSGKSSLALQLMAFGCDLLSDDQTRLSLRRGSLLATVPDQIRGRIEARGLGILSAQSVHSATIVMAIDMNRVEETRLPLRRSISYIGVSVPLYYASKSPAFAAAVLQLLKSGGRRHDQT